MNNKKNQEAENSATKSSLNTNYFLMDANIHFVQLVYNC